MSTRTNFDHPYDDQTWGVTHLIFAVGSILFNMLFIIHWRHNIYFHINCRILLWATIVANIIHSSCVAILQFNHLLKVFTVADPCDVLVSSVFCFIFRGPAFTCILTYTTIHLSMVIERAIALRNLSTYESSSASTGLGLLIFSLLFSCGLSAYCLKNYSLSGKVVYCAATTRDTLPAISLVCYSCMILEAFAILCFCYAYWIGLRKSNIYDIRTKYQAKENLTVLRLLIPLVIFHFIIFSVFMLSAGVAPSIQPFLTTPAFRAYLGVIYIIPVYTLCSPLLLWWILERYRRTRSQDLVRISLRTLDENDVYFANYAWNNHTAKLRVNRTDRNQRTV